MIFFISDYIATYAIYHSSLRHFLSFIDIITPLFSAPFSDLASIAISPASSDSLHLDAITAMADARPPLTLIISLLRRLLLFISQAASWIAMIAIFALAAD